MTDKIETTKEFVEHQRLAIESCLDAYENEDWLPIGIGRLRDACDRLEKLEAENEKLKASIKKHYVETCPEYGFCMPKIGESMRDHCAKCKKAEKIIVDILKGE